MPHFMLWAFHPESISSAFEGYGNDGTDDTDDEDDEDDDDDDSDIDVDPPASQRDKFAEYTNYLRLVRVRDVITSPRRSNLDLRTINLNELNPRLRIMPRRAMFHRKRRRLDDESVSSSRSKMQPTCLMQLDMNAIFKLGVSFARRNDGFVSLRRVVRTVRNCDALRPRDILLLMRSIRQRPEKYDEIGVQRVGWLMSELLTRCANTYDSLSDASIHVINLTMPDFTHSTVAPFWLIPQVDQFYDDETIGKMLDLPHRCAFHTENDVTLTVRDHTTMSMLLILLARLSNDMTMNSMTLDVYTFIESTFRSAMKSNNVILAIPFSAFVSRRTVVFECNALMERYVTAVSAAVDATPLAMDVENAHALVYMISVRCETCMLSYRANGSTAAISIDRRRCPVCDVIRLDRITAACESVNANFALRDADAFIAMIFSESLAARSMGALLRTYGVSRVANLLSTRVLPSALCNLPHRFFYGLTWRFIDSYDSRAWYSFGR